MPWKKSSPALVARFAAALPPDPAVEPRKMFGYPVAFVKGNFFAGLHQEDVVMRVPDERRSEVPALKSARPFDPMGGRPMKDWWVLPGSFSKNEGKLGQVLAQGLEVAKTLPAKAPKKKAAARKTAAKTAAKTARRR